MNDLQLVQRPAPISWTSSFKKPFRYFPVWSSVVMVSYSSSAVFISICAEHLPNELHSIGDRRVEWLNPGALEPDHLGSVMIRLHRTGCDLRQVNQGL